MKENIIATNFDPHACVMLVKSTTIGNNQNKVIYDTVFPYFDCLWGMTNLSQNVFDSSQKRFGWTDRQNKLWHVSLKKAEFSKMNGQLFAQFRGLVILTHHNRHINSYKMSQSRF